ncbi:AraC family transcriptional regulator [Weissella soli]|uniref:AraC family transcriptional regulator n=1 Tax=Weissella soli TaxID=155866 RepID=UPI001F37B017|nr:AraC family transcriptional regulator [Weissella soli]GJM47979.1 AraC family transcriptional regulator [Weissella soli]
MTIEQVLELLKVDNNIEAIQKKENRNINDQHLLFSDVNPPIVTGRSFFRHGNIYVGKHNRYSVMPKHRHAFVELNYMLSGQSVHYINGQRIVLKQAEILLLDKNTIQSIEPLGENDILINVLIKNNSMSTAILTTMVSHGSLVGKFMMEAAQKKTNNSVHFIHFETKNHDLAVEDIERIIVEFFDKDMQYMSKINSVMQELLIDLARFYDKNNGTIETVPESKLLISILAYIDTNYTNASLNDLGEKIGYNPKYLSRRLKQEFGNSFKEMVNLKRYQVGKNMLETTDATISEVAYCLGFESSGALYKLFSKFSDETPNSLRKNK